jgi:hypothetical protein
MQMQTNGAQEFARHSFIDKGGYAGFAKTNDCVKESGRTGVEPPNTWFFWPDSK